MTMVKGRSPIEAAMGRVMRCTRCTALMGNCNCWDKITLRCPDCGRTKQAYKDQSDPPGTAIVEAPCDKCGHGGNKPETHYYDVQGRWFNGEKFIVTGDAGKGGEGK